MNIDKDIVVRFHYILKDDSGDVLDSADESSPMTYLHGHGGLMAGLENALAGKSSGDQVEVRLSAAEAFGEREDNAEQRVPLSKTPGWSP